MLAERQERGVADQGVLSARTWRIADLPTKRALIGAGLGWGNLPEHMVAGDIEAGELVRIRPEGWSDDEHTLTLHAVHRPDVRLGEAHRWMLVNLRALCEKEVGVARAPAKRRRRTTR